MQDFYLNKQGLIKYHNDVILKLLNDKSDQIHDHELVSSTKDGFMSSTDKVAFDEFMEKYQSDSLTATVPVVDYTKEFKDSLDTTIVNGTFQSSAHKFGRLVILSLDITYKLESSTSARSIVLSPNLPKEIEPVSNLQYNIPSNNSQNIYVYVDASTETKNSKIGVSSCSVISSSGTVTQPYLNADDGIRINFIYIAKE